MSLSTKMRVLACAIAFIGIGVGLLLIFSPAILLPAGSAVAGFFGVIQSAGIIGAVVGSIPGIIGGGLFTAGIFGIHEAVMNSEVEWKSFWIQMGKGFTVGCVSHTLSLVASAGTGPYASYLGCEPRFAAFRLGAICGFFTNGISNVMNGRDFLDNWMTAVAIGGIVSFSCQSLLDGVPIDPPDVLKSLWTNIFNSTDEVLHGLLQKICWTKVTDLFTKVMTKFGPAVQQCIKHIGMDLIGILSLWFQRLLKKVLEGAQSHQREGGEPGSSGNQSGKKPSSSTGAINETTNNDQHDRTHTVQQEQNFTPQDRNNANRDEKPELQPEAEESKTVEQEVNHADQAESSTFERTDEIPYHESPEISSNHNAVHRENVVNREETLQRETQEVATSSSPDNHPGSAGQMVGRVAIAVPASLPKPGPTNLNRRPNTVAGRVEANKIHDIRMSASGNYRDNVYRQIGSLQALLSLHQEQREIAERQPPPQHMDQNRMFNTVGGGTKLGVGVPTTSNQAGPSRPPMTKKEAKKELKQKKEEELRRRGEGREGETDQKKSTISQVTKNTLDKSTKIKKDVPDENIASIHKLIAADEHGNYIMTDREDEWPKFDGKMFGVVALMGMRSSGTTTLACSILFQLGYTIPEYAAFQIRLRLGVNAYVLHKHNLIIVECCEGIDPTLENPKQAPYGALLAELFVYINCRAVIWNIPFWDDNVNRVKKYLSCRLSALQIGAASHEGTGVRKLHVVLRVHSENNKDHLTHLDHLENFLREKVKMVLEDSMEVIKSEEEELFDAVIDMHDSKVSLLKWSETAESIEQMKEYNRQIQSIASYVSSFEEPCPVTCDEFYEDALNVWTNLENSKTLEATIAKLSVEANEAEAGGSDNKIKSWFARAKAYVRRANDRAMSQKVDEYGKQMKTGGEKYKNLPKEEQSPQFFIESVLRMADIILRGALKLTDSFLKEEGVALGLEGMALLLKSKISAVHDVAALKTMFFELNLMEVLKQRNVYGFFDDCWYLLYCLANNGFRTLAMEFDFWTAAQFHLEKTGFSTYYQKKAYSQMLWYLNEMTSTDASRCVPERGGHCQMYFANNPVDDILFDFEKESTAMLEDIVTQATRDPTSALAMHKTFMKIPAQWFEESKYAKEEFGTEEERRKNQEMVMGALSCRNFEILYTMHFAQVVVKTPSLWTTLHDNVLDIGQQRLLVWQHVAVLARDSLPLCLSLHNIALEFLIQKYIRPQNTNNHFPYAVHTLCLIQYAENCHKDTKEMQSFVEERCRRPESRQGISNIHGLYDTDQRRLKLAKTWTYMLLYCLENNVVGKTLSYFCENHHGTQVTDALLQSLNTFLVKETDSNYSESRYMDRRMDLFKRISAEIEDAIKALEQNPDNQPNYVHASILRHGCELINSLMCHFYLEDPDKNDLFDDRRKLEEKSVDWRVQFYSLLLNLASVSGESPTDVLVKYGERKSGIDHDELKKIIYGTSEFKKVDVTKMHHKLVIVASDLLLSLAHDLLPGAWREFHTMQNNFKTKIEKLTARLHSIDHERQQYNAWLCKQEERRRRAKNPPAKVREFQSTSRAEVLIMEERYAVDEVVYFVAGTNWRCTTSSPNFLEITEGHIKQGKSKSTASACGFFVYNNMKGTLVGSEDTKHPLNMFLRLLEKLKKVELELNLDNNNVKTILSLHHAIDLLLECGFGYIVKMTETGTKDLLSVTSDSIRRDYIHDLHDSLVKLKNQDMRLRVCSSFTEVDAASVETLKKLRLPLAFFCKQTHDHYDVIHRLSIEQLQERRPRLNKVPYHLRHVLVRVTVTTTTCYQAVFNPQESVARVLAELQISLGVRVTGLREKNSAAILPHTKVLKDFPYVVHLHAC